ncbi:MAG: hypothetical protein MRJ92_15675 [Nitrospira sp.]|nr:hypothetical protein [Nitrospira sp.]
MGQEGCHGSTTDVLSGVQARSGSHARRAGVTVSQIAADLGMGANVLGRWQHPSPGKRILQMECINPPHQREPPL